MKNLNKMKKLLYLLLIASCSNQKPVNSAKKLVANQLDTLISGNKLFIKDTTQYDSSFIRGLVKMARIQTSFRLIDDSLIVGSVANTNPDSIIKKPLTSRYSLPTNLDLNKESRFSTRLPDKNFSLTLKRTNFTNIEYQLKQDGKILKSGNAVLQASFFFGAEVQDEENGKPMYLNQYIDKKSFEAYLKIEINLAERATFTFCIDEKTGKYETLPMFFKE
jgi:hypothetical protein